MNPNATSAAFTSVIRQPWLSVASLDRQAWDRPMSAGEVRGVEILIDRTKRSSPTGTETGTISLMTAGAPGGTSDLVVVDDGVPPPVTASPGAPGATGSPTPTRILFPSLANTPDGKGVGWFSSDVWVTNSDAVNAADIALILTPVARSVVAGPGVAPAPPVPTVHQIDVTLAPGETRHFRNILNTAGLVGASSLEVRSNATTVSATAVVMNQPLSAAAGGGAVAYASAGSPPIQPPPRVFGAEMRPVAPGEGAKVSDPEFVVSGLAYDANRRSNLLLAETSGLDTVVRVQLYQSNGAPVTKGGQPVDFSQLVPAGQTVQINYPDLFDDTATYDSPYQLRDRHLPARRRERRLGRAARDRPRQPDAGLLAPRRRLGALARPDEDTGGAAHGRGRCRVRRGRGDDVAAVQRRAVASLLPGRARDRGTARRRGAAELANARDLDEYADPRSARSS